MHPLAAEPISSAARTGVVAAPEILVGRSETAGSVPESAHQVYNRPAASSRPSSILRRRARHLHTARIHATTVLYGSFAKRLEAGAREKAIVSKGHVRLA